MTAADYRRIGFALDVLRAAGRKLRASEEQTIAVACSAIERVFRAAKDGQPSGAAGEPGHTSPPSS